MSSDDDEGCGLEYAFGDDEDDFADIPDVADEGGNALADWEDMWKAPDPSEEAVEQEEEMEGCGLEYVFGEDEEEMSDNPNVVLADCL